MKNLTLLVFSLFPVLLFSQTQTENYIKTTVYKVETQNGTTNTATQMPLTSGEKLESISYFDGLGRPVQQVAHRQSGATGKDIVTPTEYDGFGRQVKEYLPYVPAAAASLDYKPNALTEVLTFYDDIRYDADFPGMTTANINPYSQKELEPSPLNRVLKQAAPGAVWDLNAGHEIKSDYQTNAVSEVKLYQAVTAWNAGLGLYDISLVNAGNYEANQLYKTITKDENWTSGKNNTTEEFKDKEGHVVLKRTYSDYKDSNGQLISSQTAHDTYYVYDDYGNLTYVLLPRAAVIINSTALQSSLSSSATVLAGSSLSLTASNSIILSNGFYAQAGSTFTASIDMTIQNSLDDLCYQYKYDSRNRLVEKKLPGKGWEYIVYDKLDRPVLTQDANLKVQNKWLFTKYDAFSRPVYTGEYINSGNRAVVQVQADAAAVLFEIRQGASTINGTIVYYSNNAFPNTADINLFTINYYDDYSFDLDGGVTQTAYSTTPITNAKGLATGSKVRALGTTAWTTSVIYYDDKARPVYNYSKNNFLDITSTVKSQLDFIGKVLETTSTHKKGLSAEIKIVDSYSYDHAGRLLTQKQSVNGLTQEVIASNSYDELGQLISKGVGGKINQSRLQTIDYTYNIRGWLKGINDVNAIGNDLFSFKLSYNDTAAPSPLYNGNISQSFWKTANASDTGLKNYNYNYDAMNRLTQAVDGQNRYTEALSYDLNGNIKSLKRNGNQNPGLGNYGAIDDLTYEYLSGNKLNKVSDAAGNAEGFKDVAASVDYSYDANGNMKSDANKSITSISYNHLNLPVTIQMGGGTITYDYDATGVKLRKSVNSSTVTDYAGGFQYLNGNLQFFPQPEGYVDWNNGNIDYIYQYKDHLGNVRLAYKDGDKNGAVGSNDILSEDNYYPFGLKQKRDIEIVVNSNNKYKYNGKELQDELGLNMYDYGARNYDPALGRWMNIDPKAETSRRFSPFAYALNNPVFFIDPDGMEATDWYKNKKSGNYEWFDGSAKKAGYENVGKSTNVVTGDGKSYQLNNGGTFKDLGSGKSYDKGETLAIGNTGSNIVSNLSLSEKGLKMVSDIAKPIFETPQDVLFPIINQVNVSIKEGIHTGGANNSDNVLLPNTFELNNWKVEAGRSNTSTGDLSFEEGQDIINNTASIVLLPVKAATNPVVNTVVKTAVKKGVKKGMEAME